MKGYVATKLPKGYYRTLSQPLYDTDVTVDVFGRYLKCINDRKRPGVRTFDRPGLFDMRLVFDMQIKVGKDWYALEVLDGKPLLHKVSVGILRNSRRKQ